MTTYENGDDNVFPPEITNSQIEERLARDDFTNELKHATLGFENGSTKNALVDSGAYVSAIAQEELNRITQRAPSIILKLDEPPNFQFQVASGQIEKLIATTKS